VISDHLSYMRSSPFCHVPVLLTAFRLWPLFCSVSTFTLQLFQYFFQFFVSSGPKTRSHFPVHTCWAAARERRGKGGMRLAHTVYKISFEHSKIDIINEMFECLGPTALSRKREVWCHLTKSPNFYSKLTIKMESIVVGQGSRLFTVTNTLKS